LTEIGALKIKGKELIEIFSRLIRPRRPISAEITRLTGIDNEMVKNSPGAEAVLPEFFKFIDSSILIAHNTDFDIPFIKHHIKQLTGEDLNNDAVCTVKLARFLLPNLKNHKLHTVASHFGFPVANRHRAMGDAELTYQIWLKFMDLLREKEIKSKRDLDSLISRL
jgi:DNA polymerase-3 subunit alpha (Gram-positive type)